jgi:hypothetical protein
METKIEHLYLYVDDQQCAGKLLSRPAEDDEGNLLDPEFYEEDDPDMLYADEEWAVIVDDEYICGCPSKALAERVVDLFALEYQMVHINDEDN